MGGGVEMIEVHGRAFLKRTAAGKMRRWSRPWTTQIKRGHILRQWGEGRRKKWREGVMDRVDIRSVESPGMDHLGEF